MGSVRILGFYLGGTSGEYPLATLHILLFSLWIYPMFRSQIIGYFTAKYGVHPIQLGSLGPMTLTTDRTNVD